MDREYHREYSRKYYHKKRDEYKAILGGVCVVCGTDENLEFDHIDPSTKKFAIGKLLNVSKARALQELTKCQLLCKEHHREKTEASGDNKQVPHGGGKTGKRHCPCDLCKEKRKLWMREYRRSKNGG